MKFFVFKWWEKWVKPILYMVILGSTVTLLLVYWGISDENGQIAFVASIVYALVLFIIAIPINKIDRYTADKVYERESYYLALRKLREVADTTIKKISIDDTEEYHELIREFQIFTGRDDNSIQMRMLGEKRPIYARENGFVYTEKMKNMETIYLRAFKEKNVKELSKAGKKLKKYYSRSCKKLEKNYARIMAVYGGALQNLVERDRAASETDFSLNDINSKVEDIAIEIDFLRSEIVEMTGTYTDEQREWHEFCKYIFDRLKAIDDSMSELSEKMMS